MASAKFKIIITIADIPEEKLGATLASFPDKGSVQIELTQRRTASEPKPAPTKAVQSPTIPRPSAIKKSDFGPWWFDTLPPVFKAKDFVPVIEAHGFNGNSISHFIRRAIAAKMIEKVPGLLGNKVAYRRVVKR